MIITFQVFQNKINKTAVMATFPAQRTRCIAGVPQGIIAERVTIVLRALLFSSKKPLHAVVPNVSHDTLTA